MKRSYDFSFRLLSVCLMICMLISAFPDFAGAESVVPLNPSLTYTDDFSDGIIAPNIEGDRFYPGDENGANADTLTESGGKLIFERKKWIWNTDKTYGEPSVKMYAQKDKKPISGDIFAEFNLSKTREVVRVRFCDSSGNYLTQLSWEGNSLSMKWRENDLSSKSKSITAASDSTLKIAIRANINSARPVFSLWINDELQIDEKISSTDIKNADFSMVQVYTLLYSSYSKAGKIILDNAKIGYCEKIDIPTVESMIMETDFSSSELPGCFKTDISGGGSAEVSDGMLAISKTDSGNSQVGASLYTFKDPGASAVGVIGLEFDVRRENSNAVQIRSMDANGNLYYSFAWGAESVSANYSDDPLTPGESHNVFNGKTNEIHVNMLFDTKKSLYWLWINGVEGVGGKYSRSVGVGSVCYTMFYTESINTIFIDNYRIYNAIPPEKLRLEFDVSDFRPDYVLGENNSSYAVVSDLNLPSKLRYGTDVTWESSHPQIINPSNGVVSRPSGSDKNPVVTLTASFENCGQTAEKDYSFCVLRELGSGENSQEAELNEIDISYMTDEAPSQLRKSIRLCDTSLRGSPIIWTSSDAEHLSPSGRVTRPKFNEENAKVTLTATIGNYSRDFEFTVIADEKPEDPMHMSDEEFFGVWNGSGYSVSPKLDYSQDGLSEVEKFAKSGDYEKAGEALLQYFKNRNVPSPIGLGNRHSGWVDARMDGVFELGEEASYHRGLMSVESDSFERVDTVLYKPDSISKSECKTFELIARYNEYTSAYVLGTDAPDSSMVPRLRLTINGKERVYKANGSATIRAGEFSSSHIDGNEVLEAKMFGEFLSDETSRILLSFDLSDIRSEDNISKAVLSVYARKSSASESGKQLWVIDNKGKAWNEKTVTWNSLNFTVHNYNGLIGGVIWKGAPVSDVEYAYQLPRFTHARNTMTEYRETGDERYAYYLLGQIMDIISDTGSETPYPRSLDAAIRMHQFVPLMNAIKVSPYLTADFCTAFMKYMYDQFEYFPSRVDATGNWREYEQLAVLYATVAYPELSNSSSTLEACIKSWENALEKSFMPDGSYIEDTGGYHRNSFNMYRDFKKTCLNLGIELPENFDSVLHKAAYYMALTSGPGGLSLQYGDESGGKASPNRYADICDWYEDEELRFIDSFGTAGVKPGYTSYQFGDGRYTIMRSDWTKDAIYLHTNVRGGGGHGHADDNSLILMAGGRRLLVDSGKFTYNSYDPARLYGISTRGHNTLVINDASQRMSWTGDEYSVRGDIEKWTSNPRFDYLSQTTKAYPGYDHTRNIFFDKTGLFVVSDVVNPHDETMLTNYKQYWHMHPDAGISADENQRILSSDYADGKNLIIASADETSVKLEDGYYDISDGTVVSNKAGIFEKESSGKTSMDSVMLVTSDPDALLSVKKDESASATILEISVSENGKTKTYYYLNNPDSVSSSFFGYTTDARIALLCRDSGGDILSFMLSDGSYISYDGADIIKLSKSATDFAASFEADKLLLSSADSSIDAKSAVIKDNGKVKIVEYNGARTAFSAYDGIIDVGNNSYDMAKSDLDDAIRSLKNSFCTKESGGEFYLVGNPDLGEKVGKNGSKITYISNNVNLISESGELKRGFTDERVVLTLESENSGLTYRRDEEFIVPGRYNKIGKEELPFIGEKYASSLEITDSNASGKSTPDILTSFEVRGGIIEFTSEYAVGVEPGFTGKYTPALSGSFVYDLIFESDSTAMRTRFSDSAWNRKLEVYYLDDGTLVLNGNTKETYPESFGGKTVELRLCFNTSSNSVDAYIGGKLWVDDFALDSAGYKNIQYAMTTHHCATIMGKWRSGQGTTRIYSSGVYDVVADSEVSSVMMSSPEYHNGGIAVCGINEVTIPIIATDEAGEKSDAVLIYAIYSDESKKELLGVAYEKIDLCRYSHREYSAAVILDKVNSGAIQKVFAWDGSGNLKPIGKLK